MLLRSSLAVVVSLGVAGCATSNYRPANSPRLSVTYGGIYKNGKKYDNLTDAVADNPRALEEARRGQSIAATSRWLQLGGAAVMLAGSTMLIVAGEENDKSLGPAGWAGLATVGTGLVITIVGVFVNSNAVPHWLDAMNIYNDDVEAKMCVKRPAPAPTGTPATSTQTPTPASR